MTMDENLPTGAEALNAASERYAAVPCPEPSMPASISQVVVRLVGKTRFGEVPCDFTYSAADPHAVQVIFHQGSARAITWTFSRDLLTEAMATRTTAGVGDVRVDALQQEVVLTLHPGTGDSFSFSYNRLGVAAFMSKTMNLVMIGAESYDGLDAEIAELLA